MELIVPEEIKGSETLGWIIKAKDKEGLFLLVAELTCSFVFETIAWAEEVSVWESVSSLRDLLREEANVFSLITSNICTTWTFLYKQKTWSSLYNS